MMGLMKMFQLNSDNEAGRFYDAGAAAFKAGFDFWECPYAMPSGNRDAMGDWLAGWMMAKQMDKLMQAKGAANG